MIRHGILFAAALMALPVASDRSDSASAAEMLRARRALRGVAHWQQKGFVPADSAYGRVQLSGLRVSLRYEQWTMLKEPVEQYRMKFTGPWLIEFPNGSTIRASDYMAMDTDGVDVQQKDKGRVDVTVPQELMDRTGLVQAWFLLTGTYSGGLGRRMVYVGGRYPGTFGRPGQWGWDVPGSPSWGEFLASSPKLFVPFLQWGKQQELKINPRYYLDAEPAEKVFAELLDEYGTRDANGDSEAWSLSLHGLEIGLGDLLFEIDRAAPGTRFALTATEDQLAKGRDYALLTSILDDVERDIRQALAAGRDDPSVGAGKAGRRLALARTLVDGLEDVDPLLQLRLADLESQRGELGLTQQLRKLGRAITQRLATAQPGAALNLQDEIKALAQIEAAMFELPNGGSPALRDQHQRVRRLTEPGASTAYVVLLGSHHEKWRGPTLTLRRETREPIPEWKKQQLKREAARKERERKRRYQARLQAALTAAGGPLRSKVIAVRMPRGFVQEGELNWDLLAAPQAAAVRGWTESAMHRWRSSPELLDFDVSASWFPTRAAAEEAWQEAGGKTVAVSPPPAVAAIEVKQPPR